MFSGTKYLILAAIILGYMSLAWPTEAALLQVTPAKGETLPSDAAEKAAAVKNVTKVERYLFVKTEPHDVIGIEAGAPLRIITSGGDILEGKLEAGKVFRKADEGKDVAIIGKVYAEDYGYRGGMGPMATMKHFLEVGQTLKLKEDSPRIRVLGTFTVKPESEASKVFLPLATAQKLFNRSGQLSHIFVTVKGDPEATAKELQAALGGGVKLKVVSR